MSRPEVAVDVMRDMGYAAMIMPVCSAGGYYQTVILLRERVKEFVYKAEFKDRVGSVYVDIPNAHGMRRMALAREPFKLRHNENFPAFAVPDAELPMLAASMRRSPLPSVTKNALILKRLLIEKRAKSQSELAKIVSMSPATVSKTLSVLELPKTLFDILHHHPHRFGARLCYAISRHYKIHGDAIRSILEDFAWRVVELPLSHQGLKAFETQARFD